MGYMTADKFLFYQAGMDPDLSEMRPGQLLMSHTIERAVQLGCVEYDFLRGSEAYKQMWANAARHTVTKTLYGHGWRAKVAQAAHWVRIQARAQKRRFDKSAAPAPVAATETE